MRSGNRSGRRAFQPDWLSTMQKKERQGYETKADSPLEIVP